MARLTHPETAVNRKMRRPAESVCDYVLDVSRRPPPGMDDLVAANAAMPRGGGMATEPIQGQFLGFLVRVLGARRAFEVGVFTGIGTLWIAEAVGSEGTVVACDVDDAAPAVGRPSWEKAGVADRIDLRIAPAEETLRSLIEAGEAGTFDFGYIDADKIAYPIYYEQSLTLLRPGGVLAFDNMLQGDRVADPGETGEPVDTIRALNASLGQDDRVDVSFLPLGDGLYLVRKR